MARKSSKSKKPAKRSSSRAKKPKVTAKKVGKLKTKKPKAKKTASRAKKPATRKATPKRADALGAPIAFVATTNAERARAFYEEKLGLRFVRDEEYALVFDLDGTMLRIQKVASLEPAKHTVLGWSVGDIRAVVRALSGRGVHTNTYPFLPQDEEGIWASPGGALIAWFKDPDGNTLSVTQFPRGK